MPRRIPESVERELSRWGERADLGVLVAGLGNCLLAVAYANEFWPEFEVNRDYILRAGCPDDRINAFERQPNATPKSVEWVLNHLHLADIQAHGCEDCTKDKLIYLGNLLKEIYQVKLAWQFPDRPCIVEFYQPEDPDDLIEYQISFWQAKHD